MNRTLLPILLAILFCCGAPAYAAPAWLVAAPDRGFVGNEEVRDAIATLPAGEETESVQVVFVTDEGTEARLDQALAALPDAAAPVVLMPLYLSAAHPDMSLLRSWSSKQDGALLGRLFGGSEPALAALESSLRAIEHPDQTALVVLGHGAKDAEQAAAMTPSLQRMLATAAEGVPFASTKVVIWDDSENMDAETLRAKLAMPTNPETASLVVLPFHLGPKLDPMMGFTPGLKRAARDIEGLTVLDAGPAPQPAFEQWLARETARYRDLPPGKIGVVVHAHGARWQWNETMRQGAAALEDRYLVEYAFSMGDPDTLEHAIRHLEQRGAKAVVIVRVFSMADSFRDGIVRFIGQAWEDCESPASPDKAHQGMHGMHGGAMQAPHALLQTSLPVLTVGGIEDNPLFAKALYQRALAISEDPARETLILVAHGLGTADGNARWKQNLESLRSQIQALGGDRFRAIEVALWSEDWPELRQSAIEHVRSMVEDAAAHDSRVLIVPARTLGQGPADRYLDGLDYTLGEGFAPHPLFAEWLDQQVRLGMDKLRYDAEQRLSCRLDAPAAMHGHH